MKPNPRRPCFGRHTPYQAATDAYEANVSCVTVAPLYIYLIRDISFIADLGDLRRQPLYLLGCRPIPTPDLGFKTPTSTPSSTLFMHPSASLEPIDLCDRCHLFAYHSTSHVTLDILDTRCIFVASATLHVAYQIGRLPFICKGCCPLVAYFSKILYITSFLRVRARDCTRSIGGGGPGIGVFRDTSSDSGRVWVVAEVLAAGRGVVHITVCAWLCAPLRAARAFVWVIGRSGLHRPFTGRVCPVRAASEDPRQGACSLRMLWYA